MRYRRSKQRIFVVYILIWTLYSNIMLLSASKTCDGGIFIQLCTLLHNNASINSMCVECSNNTHRCNIYYVYNYTTSKITTLYLLKILLLSRRR